LILRYDVSGDFALAGRAALELKCVLEKLGAEPDVIKKASVALYEAEINACVHAGGGIAEAEIGPEKIIMRITDTGQGISDVRKAMKKDFSTATEETRRLGIGAGMGFYNMKKNSDLLQITSALGAGTEVYMEVGL